MKSGKLMRRILGIVAFVLLILAGFKTVFKWDWNAWLFVVIEILVGIYLISESTITNWKGFMSKAKKPTGLIHVVSFALGLLILYIAIGTMPSVNFLKLYIAPLFNGIVLMLCGLWSIIEGFVD